MVHFPGHFQSLQGMPTICGTILQNPGWLASTNMLWVLVVYREFCSPGTKMVAMHLTTPTDTFTAKVSEFGGTACTEKFAFSLQQSKAANMAYNNIIGLLEVRLRI